MICGSINKCEEIITKLKVKLAKVKQKGNPDTLLKNWTIKGDARFILSGRGLSAAFLTSLTAAKKK
jgi:hypothetical protein